MLILPLDPSMAVVSYWWKDVHLALVNRKGSLLRNSVVRLIDLLNMTKVVDCEIKPQIKQQQKQKFWGTQKW